MTWAARARTRRRAAPTRGGRRPRRRRCYRTPRRRGAWLGHGGRDGGGGGAGRRAYAGRALTARRVRAESVRGKAVPQPELAVAACDMCGPPVGLWLTSAESWASDWDLIFPQWVGLSNLCFLWAGPNIVGLLYAPIFFEGKNFGKKKEKRKKFP